MKESLIEDLHNHIIIHIRQRRLLIIPFLSLQGRRSSKKKVSIDRYKEMQELLIHLLIPPFPMILLPTTTTTTTTTNENKPSIMTYLIENAPGHCMQWNGEKQRYEISWSPVFREYSPPFLLPHIVHSEISLRDNSLWKKTLPRIIGKRGKHFIRVTVKSGCHYIFYHEEKERIEIWGYRTKVQQAYRLLWKHITYVVHQDKNQHESSSTTTSTLSLANGGDSIGRSHQDDP